VKSPAHSPSRVRRIRTIDAELRELAAAEQARAARLEEWHGGVEDPVRRREILEASLEYIERQRELLRRRREELDELETELAARRKRAQAQLRKLPGAVSASRRT
jgi:chromosome segregation ATPase